ncbi:MAG: hypothetical protein K6G10_04370 [Butyrivibrio sp.]|nr:hypothetical protein [Butyrivibrio sp.]
MKKKIVYLMIAGMIALTGCGSAAKGEDAGAESIFVAQDEAEETAGASENAEGGSEGEVGLANPWRDINEEEVIDEVRIFIVPEGSTNIQWSKMETADSESPLIQVTFDLDGLSYTARYQYGAPEYADISGMNYEWSVTDEGTLNNWGDGNMEARFYRYIGDDEWVDVCTWYDIEIGIAYSLSTTSQDLEGFDISAIADAMYPGNELLISSFVEEAAGKGSFDSYDEIISYLTKDQAYAYIQLIGYDGDLLAVTEYTYSYDDKTTAAIEAAIYAMVGDRAINIGNVYTAGTSYPVSVKDGVLFACNPHSYETYFVSPDGQGLMMKDLISETYDENQNATYSGFLRETNSFDDTVDFTGGEKEFQEHFDLFLEATPVNFTVIK